MSGEPLRRLALSDGRYAPEAFHFLLEALDHYITEAGRADEEGPARHVTGRELLGGIRAYALKLFGPLGAQVWRSWGVKATIDWGEIVFLLVEEKILNRQETDTKEDFRDGFDFDEAFVKSYEPELPPELGPFQAEGEG